MRCILTINVSDPRSPPAATAEVRLSTPRLDLLPIDRSHASAMFSILDDPALHEFTGGNPPEDVDALSRLYEWWEQRRSPDGSELWLNWVLWDRELDELVGHLQAGVGPAFAAVAWVVGRRWQGRGYASEAATELVTWLLSVGVKDIRASIHPDHVASIRVAERAGLCRTDLGDDGEVIWRLQVENLRPSAEPTG